MLRYISASTYDADNSESVSIFLFCIGTLLAQGKIVKY